MHSRSALLWVLSPHILTSVLALPSPFALPQDTTPVNDDVFSKLKNLVIQPNSGGGQADDCGAGPVKLDADTWNANKMDDLIQSVWDSGKDEPNFDFHQVFADKYGVDLYCRNSFTNCEGDPVNCGDLKGTTAEKTQGWLGIKAIMSAQDMFLQTEKATSASDGAKTAVIDLLQKVNQRPLDNTSFRKLAVNIVGGLVGTVTTWGIFATGPGGVAAVALLGAVGAAFVNDLIDNNIASHSSSPDWSFSEILDRWDMMKLAALQAVDMSHNAAFSNGQAGGKTGYGLVNLLVGGQFAGTAYPEAYEDAENSLMAVAERITFSKTIESFWQQQYNAFYLYVPGVVDNCKGWHGNTGKKDEMRYCAEKGMYILMGINPDNDNNMNSPPGAGTSDVASYGGYNINLADLHQSSAKTYEGHGLVHDGISYFMKDIFDAWRNSPDEHIFAQPGFFYLPVCELQPQNWPQSDKASKDRPPCDCLTATDPWGSKFMDVATPTVQNWIKGGCH